MNLYKSEKGQMLLIVVLVMVVALTVGLSVATRSITNVKISKQNEESQRAFQAAEAGLELNIKKALEGNEVNVGTDLSFDNNSSFTIPAPVPLASSGTLNDGNTVPQDRGIDVWLTSYDNFKINTPNNVNNLVVHWGDDSQSCPNVPAIELLILSGSNTSPSMEKRVYDPCVGAGRLVNSSGAVNGSLQDTYRHSTAAFSVANGIVMKVVPLYAPSKIYISAGSGLPPQGRIIVSEGRAGSTIRRLEYTQFFPEFPTEMFYAILAQSQL